MAIFRDGESGHYWLCCGSLKYPHGEKTCHEAQSGHPERVRYGTAKEHSEWQMEMKNHKKVLTLVTGSNKNLDSLVEAIKDAFYSQQGVVTVAESLGCLEIAKAQILAEVSIKTT